MTHYTARLMIDPETSATPEYLGPLMDRAMQAVGAAPGPHVTLRSATAEAGFELVLSVADTEKSGEVLLAKLAFQIVSALPVTHVQWCDTTVQLPRDRFLDTLSPLLAVELPGNVTPIAPRRVAKAAAVAARPDTASHKAMLARMLPALPAQTLPGSANDNTRVERLDAHVNSYYANLRVCMLRDADEDELELAREQRGPMPVEVRLSTWAVSLTVATVSLPVAAPVMIYNIARGEDMRVASLAMGIAGLFLALDTSGAMAGVLSTF